MKVFGMVVALVLVGGTAHAHERGYLELGGGGALPVLDGTYRDHFDAGPSLWAAAVLNPRRVPAYAWMRPFALEMSFDWTFLGDSYDADDTNDISFDFNRYRAMIGVRYHHELEPGIVAFGRVAAGVDFMAWEENGTVAGVETNDDDIHVGGAFELGGGVRYRLGPVDLAGHLALPMALHKHETYGAGVEIDHFGFDIAARVSVGIVY